MMSLRAKSSDENPQILRKFRERGERFEFIAVSFVHREFTQNTRSSFRSQSFIRLI